MTIPTPMRERCANAARKYLERCADLGTPISYADLTDAVLAELETPTEEQDAAARREGFEQAREMAAKWHEEQAHEMQKRYYEIRDLGDDPGGADQSRAFHLDCAGNLRALTPDAPSEKENEGDE